MIYFCCQGGESRGYENAGFRIVKGVDWNPQPRYPYPFEQANAIQHFRNLIDSGMPGIDLVAGGPPCQKHTKAQRIMNNDHPDFIEDFRALCIESGKPYVIENVPEAPLIDPVLLCGAMFPGLRTYRHRIFESNMTITPPVHPVHLVQEVKMGRWVNDGEWYFAVGNFSNVSYIKKNMGVEWMTRDGVRECIPPVYAEYIGRQILEQM